MKELILISIFILVLFSFREMELYVCGKKAEVYNKICQPAIKATASDAWWLDLSVRNCNIKIN